MGSRIALCAGLGLLAGLAFPVGSRAAAEYKVLYSFQGGNDGAYPQAPLALDSGGNIFGATQAGGGRGCGGVVQGCGVIFKLAHDRNEKILFAFHKYSSGKKGAYPWVSFVENADGKTVYGTTEEDGFVCGGTGGRGCGTIYSLGPKRQKETLYRFKGRGDGYDPVGLMQDSSGNIYGVTGAGGSSDGGTLFEFGPGGVLTLIHTFTGGQDGAGPTAPPLEDSEGNLFGTTVEGGHGENCGEYTDCGVIYEVTSAGQEKVLHAFQGGSDGAFPSAGLTIDSAGNLYGTTFAGGDTEVCGSGCGTVYKLAPDGAKTILYTFRDKRDGRSPLGNLIIDTVGNLYGLSWSGGDQGGGVFFELSSSGRFIVLHAFKGGLDGWVPASLVADGAGNIYGATSSGGASNNCDGGCGTIFRWRPGALVRTSRGLATAHIR